MSVETWAAILGYEGFYEASTLGRIRSVDRTINATTGPRKLRGRVVFPFLDRSHGYRCIKLTKDGIGKCYRVHILVAAAFYGERPASLDVAHTDGDKQNNAIENLRYATRKENSADSIRHGTQVRGERVAQSKLTEDAVRDIRRSNDTARLVAAKYGISVRHVRSLKQRTRWAHVV